MSARLAVRELELSADLFLSEKAYFSAESGVEKALLKLKTEPLAHVEPTIGDVNSNLLEDDFTEVSIRNLIDTTPDNFPPNEFFFTLEPLQSQRFRFQKDTDNTITTAPDALDGMVKIDIEPAGKFYWRILCDDGSENTLALQAEANNDISNLITQTGALDDGTNTDFASWSGIDKKTCFVTIQNLATDARTFTFSGTTMGPHAAHIHAIGEHQNRTKHIRFDYAQSTLGSLFDFSFLHSDEGL